MVTLKDFPKRPIPCRTVPVGKFFRRVKFTSEVIGEATTKWTTSTFLIFFFVFVLLWFYWLISLKKKNPQWVWQLLGNNFTWILTFYWNHPENKRFLWEKLAPAIPVGWKIICQIRTSNPSCYFGTMFLVFSRDVWEILSCNFELELSLK